ncbi:BQ5605_C046g12276 [Microbotryum silenes-dioicae]|uniref:BQ5605_C046g12276 protein n=1 Tax=Microbotryum silenes-dioicae TaxID=796604 RepID=A0A2X0NBA3_9BASI|nr:BQ5605_C046g12276 [Microbotryum silenes-dioicae]
MPHAVDTVIPIELHHVALDSYIETLPVRLLARMAIAAWVLTVAVLALAGLHPSPWLSDNVALVLSPQQTNRLDSHRYALSTTSTSSPVRGCQNPEIVVTEPRENAAITLLVREQDLAELLPTLRNFEKRFNRQFRYAYVFLTAPVDPPFSTMFQEQVVASLPEGAVVEWATVEPRYWRIPETMDVANVRSGFEQQQKDGVQYAGREGYHHMCRYFSGLWVRTAALQKYDWYWRLEPGVRFYCTISYDPFRFMALNHKIYGFVITIVENMNTIPTLFDSILELVQKHGLVPGSRLWQFLLKKGDPGAYSGCHFWTNFEIGDLRFFRSEPYQTVFNELDQAGGFFSERWGDAPVRSLALGLLSDVDRIHYFEDFAYQHDWFMHCPQEKGLGCDCQCPVYSKDPLPKNELTDVDHDWRFSCLDRWKETVGTSASSIHPLPPNNKRPPIR